jgi:hypothetical protein
MSSPTEALSISGRNHRLNALIVFQRFLGHRISRGRIIYSLVLPVYKDLGGLTNDEDSRYEHPARNGSIALDIMWSIHL